MVDMITMSIANITVQLHCTICRTMPFLSAPSAGFCLPPTARYLPISMTWDRLSTLTNTC
jgi:hypothetical protein